ncbi:hypothetical protein MKK75_29415 [Methylobacterium sp. J-030]|uniref:hypothetical protein n=1 Tax=Methylobacterium sp. J-030 TaxID=2836627 RepID=UPI001FBB500C|nr:hypothetical protein [Methylobacterium sp. J-030]MCJ2072865.1 hypothetical protein [Methylobacterium sp. J-030]
MATIRHAVILGVLLGAAPALAQGPGQAPGTASGATPAGRGGRQITATGQTKPPVAGAPAAGTPRPVNEAEMIKAQKAAEARSKAWDSKMRNTMGSICHGC